MKDHTCNKTQEALAAYLDGENAALQSVEVQSHLTTCEDCQAIYAEIQNALATGYTDESSFAFPQNGAVKPTPDAKYWNELPDRVMARSDAMKGAAPLQVAPQPKRFRDARFVKFFAESKFRPALALVAVVALVFIITRTMQDSLPGPERMKAVPNVSAPALESAPASAEEDKHAQPSTLAEAPVPAEKLSSATEKSMIAANKPAPSSAEVQGTKTEQAALRLDQTAPLPETAFSVETRSQVDDQSKKSEDKVNLAYDESVKGEAPASVEQVQPVLAKEATEDREITDTGEAAGAATAMSLRTTSQPLRSRAKIAVSQAAPSVSESSYSQALWRAQQAATPKAQQIIWQDFLSAASDSTYIKLAIAQLAQSMLAQVDSNSSAEQVKSTLRFLEQHEAVLRSQLGVEKLSSEMRRVRLLQEQKNKP